MIAYGIAENGRSQNSAPINEPEHRPPSHHSPAAKLRTLHCWLSLGARTFSETFAADNTAENMAADLADAFSPAQQAAELADPLGTFLIAEPGETNNVPVGYAMIRSGDVPPELTAKIQSS